MYEIVEQLKELRKRLEFRKGQEAQVRTQLEEAERTIDESRKTQNLKREAVVLVESAGRTARDTVSNRLAEVVSFALQSIFGSDYRLDVFNTLKRNAVWTDFAVGGGGSNSTLHPDPPLDTRGGGVVDVVSLALRSVFLELYAPKIDGPLILDEPTKHLSKRYSGRAAELLRALAERTGRQIILVTHDPELAKEAATRRTI